MNELNDFGVFIGDVYVLNYYNILVFFLVCRTTEKTVFLIELATKRYKNGIMLTKRLKPSKNALIIINNNSKRNGTYQVVPNKDLSLPIKIDMNLPIYKKALERTEFPLIGTFYATKVIDYTNRYWLLEEKLDKIKNMA